MTMLARLSLASIVALGLLGAATPAFATNTSQALKLCRANPSCHSRVGEHSIIMTINGQEAVEWQSVLTNNSLHLAFSAGGAKLCNITALSTGSQETKMSIRHFNKTGVLITTLIATSFVLALSEPALARIKGPALDSFSAGCLALQTAGDQLIAEYKNASNARREEILQQLRNNGRTWREIGCQAVFGDISRLVLTPGGLRNGITWDMLNQSSSDGNGSRQDNGPKMPESEAPGEDVFLY